MKKAPQQKVAAGVGTAVGAVICGTLLWAGCQPGTLPCDKDSEWKSICAAGGSSGSSNSSSGSGGSSSSGSTGGTSGGSSSGGSSGGGQSDAGSSNAGGGISAATAMKNCSAYKTVGDFDSFIEMKCASAGCHTSKSPTFGDFEKKNFYEFAMTAKAKFACGMAPLVDKSDPTKGMFWIKIHDMPTCPGGSGVAGAKMPSLPSMALTDDETKCMEAFLNALAGK